MKITVNGDVKEVKDGITISELIEQERLRHRSMSVFQ